MKDINLVTVLISASVSILVALLGLILGYIRHKADLRTALNKIHEEISFQLVKERIEPYCELMKELKKLSSYNRPYNDPTFRKELLDVKKSIQDALFNKVGVIASHDTRQFLRLVRLGIDEFLENKISSHDLRNIVWALHFSLRGDLGIKQPHWDSEIEAFRKKNVSMQQKALGDLLKSDYWDFIRIDSVFYQRSRRKWTHKILKLFRLRQ